MKLWVDDIRPAPEGWTKVETISEAISALDRFCHKDFNNPGITHVSLDHDISIPFSLADSQTGKQIYKLNVPSPDTFRVVAKYMVQMLSGTNPSLNPDVVVTTHSSNPIGRRAIVEIFEELGVDCLETPLERSYRK